MGIPPKRLCRIVRFDHALLLLTDGADAAEAAQTAGYADQAHMIRDFREFAHTTPAQFMARRYAIVEASRPAMERRLSNPFNTGR